MALCDRPYFRLSSEPGGLDRPVGRRSFPASTVLPYILAQVARCASLGAGVLYLIASGKPGFDLDQGLCLQRLWRSFARAATPCRRPWCAKWS